MGQRQRREFVGNEIAISAALTNLITGRFKWSGLPERLTSEQLERFICLWNRDGLAAAFHDPSGGVMILPAYPSGDYDIYWLPRSYTVTGANYDRVIDADECIPIYNDYSHQSLLPILDDTITQLARVWAVMGLNLDQQVNPIVFAGTKEEIQSLKEANRRRNEFESIIAITQSAMNTVETAKRFFPTRSEYMGAQFIEQYHQITNRLLTVLGINNQPIEKRERLVTGETTANNQLILYYRDTATRIRENAANDIVKRFGIQINVEWLGGELSDIMGTDAALGVNRVSTPGVPNDTISGE